MKFYEICFKTAATCLIIVITLGIAIWITHLIEIIFWIKTIAVFGGVALAIGAISSIWEMNND